MTRSVGSRKEKMKGKQALDMCTIFRLLLSCCRSETRQRSLVRLPIRNKSNKRERERKEKQRNVSPGENTPETPPSITTERAATVRTDIGSTEIRNKMKSLQETGEMK